MTNDYLQFEDVFSRFTYPTGEVHVEMKRPVPERCVIETHCRNAEDLFATRMAADIAPHATYFIPYLPFARHDHRRHRLDGFPIDVVDALLDNVNVIIADPHSEVTGTRYRRHITQEEVVNFFRSNLDGIDYPLFLIPDAGATKKAYTWLRPEDDYIQGYKIRDRENGQLSGFGFIPTVLNPTGRDVVIVDDICDGGGTFIGLMKKFMEQARPRRTELWVTHGMFQPGKWPLLKDVFSRVVSFENSGNKFLTRQPPFKLFEFNELLEDL